MPVIRRLAFLLAVAAGGAPPESSLLDILEQELNRNFPVLREKGDPAPYFLSYAVTEIQNESAAASFGAVQGVGGDVRRYLDVSVRVGSPELDNYRPIRGDRPRFAGGIGVPLNDAPGAIRRRLWLETDRVYRGAAQRFINIKAAEQTNIERESAADFSTEAPQKASELPPKLSFDRAAWAVKARQWSALFDNPSVLASQVAVTAQREAKYFVSTEGARLEHGRQFARIMIVARGKAADGMDLVTTESFEAADPSRLPDDDVVKNAVKKAQKDLLALMKAPAVEPYIGPAILAGEAAGVFFHEIFGHRIEGHRQKDETEGQTFSDSIGKQILPSFLSLDFDATRRQMGDVDLNGWYGFDDEGVKAQNVNLVENGVLKTFLLSRSPVGNFQHSNGHGRKQPGREVVARQSNLIVRSTRKVPDAELRKMLIEEVKKQSKSYGLYFAKVTGGYTTTGRRGLQAYTVVPLIVYRVWADGRPDELVRGVDIVGTPLSSFARIMATSDKPGIFNGYCGAESGTVPVSAISPSLLISELEIQKKERSLDRPPYLDRPRDKSE